MLETLDYKTLEAIEVAIRYALNYGTKSIVNPCRDRGEYHELWESLQREIFDLQDGRES